MTTTAPPLNKQEIHQLDDLLVRYRDSFPEDSFIYRASVILECSLLVEAGKNE